MYEQLVDHLTVNRVLPVRQSAYRKHHSTESALTHLHSDLITHMDQSLHTLLLSLDLSSAFDSIDHNLLLDELSNVGVRGGALELIRSYLTGRHVQVAIGNAISDPLPLQYGVPQGSVLGPLLFSLYTRRLSQLLDDMGLSYHMYADDTQVYCTFRDEEFQAIKDKITSALHSIKSWLASMKLRLNFSKTKVILFSPKHRRLIMKEQFGSLNLVGDEIKLSSEVKILGVIFDDALNFNTQISSVVRACNFALHGIQVAREFLPRDILISTVTHEVLTRLDYCNSLYIALPKYQLRRLQLVMNRAARLIFGLPRRAHITPSLRRLHWLPIGPRIDYKVILIAYKAQRFAQPEYIARLLPASERSGRLQHAVSIGGHRFSERSFQYAAPRLFNKIPPGVTSSIFIETFKARLKTFIFTSAHDHCLDSLLHYSPCNDYIMSR